MTLLQVITTIFEILTVAVLFWGFFHEDHLIAFEKRLLANIRRRRLKVVHAAYSTSKTIKF